MKAWFKHPFLLLVFTLLFLALVGRVGMAFASRLDEKQADALKLDYTTLRYGRDTLLQEFGDDSWKAMIHVYKYWQETGDTNIYSVYLVGKSVKFQYPPTVLLLPEIQQGFNFDRIVFYDTTIVLFFILSLATLPALAAWALRQYDRQPRGLRETLLFCLLTSLLAFTFYPLVKASSLGQIQTWLNALFALALLLYATGRGGWAGLVLGVMTSIKPQYGVFLLWGLARREKNLTLSMLAAMVVGAAAAISQFGVGMYFDYLTGLSFLSRHGESYFPNQSVNGLLGRILSLKYPDLFNNVEWRGRYFPPYNSVVYYATLVSGILLLAFPFLKGRNTSPLGRAADFALMALGLTLASPIAWEHHYGVLLPMFALLWPALWFDPVFARRPGLRIAFVACYIVAANFIPAANLLAATPFNLLQSYLFFAALGAFALLYVVKSRSPVTPVSPSHS